MLQSMIITLQYSGSAPLSLAVPPPEGGVPVQSPWMSIAVISVIAVAAIVVIVTLALKGKRKK